MEPLELNGEVAKFFDEFVVAFQSFQGVEIARRYVAPYVALQRDGSLASFGSQAEVVDYFQTVVGAYHEEGCRSCRYRDLVVAPVGRQSALATVTWDLFSIDGVVLNSWRESYNLCRVDGRWRIFASVDHVA